MKTVTSDHFSRPQKASIKGHQGITVGLDEVRILQLHIAINNELQHVYSAI